MPLSNLLIGLAVIAFIAILIFFPGARTLLKGFIGIFIKDLAATPEGAQAIYDKKIDDVQKKYNAAHNALSRASGRVETTTNELNAIIKRIANVESQCEALVKAGNIEAAKLKVEERDELLLDKERTEELLKAYKINERDAREAFEAFDKELRNMKKEAKRIVDNIKTKMQLKEAYDEMDELKKVTEADKLLDHVRERSKELDEEVTGARTIHESKLSTKLQRAEAAAKKEQSSAYLDGLMKKYNQGGTTSQAKVPPANKSTK